MSENTIELSSASAVKMRRQEIWAQVDAEMKRAKKKYKSFPDHPAAQAGVVVKQSGDLMKASLNVKYKRGNGLSSEKIQMKKSAIKTIVAAFRLLEQI